MEDFEELRTEQENGDHVGDNDEADGHISDIPNLLDLHRDRKDGQDKVDPLENLHQLFTEEVLHAGAELDIEAKVAGIGKQHNGDGKDDNAELAPSTAEGVEGEDNAGVAVAPHTTADDSQSGQRADDDTLPCLLPNVWATPFR